MKIQGLEINKYLLWDVDMQQLDVRKNKTYIISRVLTRGALEDIRAILNYYSKDELKEAVLKSRTLNEKAMYFAAHYLNLRFEDFTCYKQKQSGLNFLPHYGS